MKVVVVGFKVSEENSVYYRKARITDNIMNTDEELQVRFSEMGELLHQAWDKGAEFVSVRFIK